MYHDFDKFQSMFVLSDDIADDKYEAMSDYAIDHFDDAFNGTDFEFNWTINRQVDHKPLMLDGISKLLNYDQTSHYHPFVAVAPPPPPPLNRHPFSSSNLGIFKFQLGIFQVNIIIIYLIHNHYEVTSQKQTVPRLDRDWQD